MKQQVQYIVYAKESPKTYSGLIGEIDMHVIHLLLIGGKQGIVEYIDNKDPVKFYTEFLKEQDMYIKKTSTQVVQGVKRVWIEIDLEKTDLSEFTQWRDCAANDTDTLAWKTYWYPCTKGTTQECLGLAVVSNETPLFQGKSLTLHKVFQTILMG